MRFLTGLLTASGLLFGGYWLAGSTAVDRGFAGLIDSLRNQGWAISYGQINTAGFPARFDTQLVDINLTDPTGSFGWQSPSLQVFAPSYWPTTITAILPESQIVTLPDQRLTLRSTDLRTAISVKANTTLPLKGISAETGPTRIISDQGWDLALDGITAAFRATDTDPAGYDLLIQGTRLALPAALISQLDPGGHLPAAVDQLKLDLGLTLDRPLDRFAAVGTAPQLQSLTLRNASVTWGNVILSAAGTLTIDLTGRPVGEIIVTGTNWRQLFAMAVGLGLLKPEVAPTWERGFAALAQGSDQIKAPIRFQNGFMSLGPIPLGPAPRF